MDPHTPTAPLWSMYITDPMAVTPLIGAFVDAPDEPLAHARTRRPWSACQDQLPLTFWVGGQPLASCWYTPDDWQCIRTSPLFHSSVRVMVGMRWHPLEHRGFMRLDVAALAGTEDQAAAFHALAAGSPRTLPVIFLADGRSGLSLGHHWSDISDEERTRMCQGGPEGRWAFRVLCHETVRKLRELEITEVAAELLRSVPGIGHELAEGPSARRGS